MFKLAAQASVLLGGSGLRKYIFSMIDIDLIQGHLFEVLTRVSIKTVSGMIGILYGTIVGIYQHLNGPVMIKKILIKIFIIPDLFMSLLFMGVILPDGQQTSFPMN